jgi:hypothetical protein
MHTCMYIVERSIQVKSTTGNRNHKPTHMKKMSASKAVHDTLKDSGDYT